MSKDFKNMDVEIQSREEQEERADDTDFNAIDAWAVLASSHLDDFPEAVTATDTQAFLLDQLRVNRKRALRPARLLKLGREITQADIDEENKRRSEPYKDGIVILFGHQYAFGYDHAIYPGKLDETGVPSEIGIEMFKDGNPVDPSTLSCMPEALAFYNAPKIEGNRVTLSYKNDI